MSAGSTCQQRIDLTDDDRLPECEVGERDTANVLTGDATNEQPQSKRAERPLWIGFCRLPPVDTRHTLFGMRRRAAPAEQYPWLLTADPPVCAVGPSLGTLKRCDRRRRAERCYCRFAAADIAEDLISADRLDLAQFLEAWLEAEDVEELADEVTAIDVEAIAEDALAERLTILRDDLRRLVNAGSGLTDRYSDELD